MIPQTATEPPPRLAFALEPPRAALTLAELARFRIAGLPRHVGLVVDTDRFLHMPSRETSCVERLSSPMWAKRIEGYYVLKDSAAA